MRLASLLIASALQLPAAAQGLPDGRALLEREATALQGYSSYEYTEETTSQITMMGAPMSIPMTMQVQVVNPNKSRMEMKAGNITSAVVISDGDATWTYIPMLNQYSKSSGSETSLDRLGSQIIGDRTQILSGATTKGSETLEVDGAHDCWVVESRIAKADFGGLEIQDAVYVTWIDKQTGIAMQRTISAKMQGGPIPGPLDMQTKTIKRALKVNEPLPPSLFTFAPPADAKESDLLQGLGAAAAGLGLTPPPPSAAPKQPQTPRDPGKPEAYVPFLNPIHQEEPEWPESAKQKGIQGMVQLLVTVSPQGLVSDAEALTGPEILRKPALDAVKLWVFQPVMRNGHAVSAYTEATVDFLDHSKPITTESIGSDLNQEMVAAQRLMEIQNRFPRTPEQVLFDLEQDLTGRDGESRSDALPQLAKAAVAAGALEKATRYADELIASVGHGGWNDGAALHDGNMVRGLVALRNGNTYEAARNLIEAGKTTGGPQLSSFGPNMTLASELLDKGARDAVLEYLTLCKKFWTMGSSQLDAWIKVVESGGKPAFGANLLY
jgi:TonB family protein